MKRNNPATKDAACTLGMLFIVIALLYIVCNIASCSVNRAIAKGVTDEVNVRMPIPQSPVDSVAQARFEQVLLQLQNENQERIGNCIQAINGNMTLWMSLICAVCTLLPIASNLYYSHQMSKEERTFTESLERQQRELDQETTILRIIQMSSTLTILCDMQQLFRQHNVFLTGEKELGQTLSALERYVQDIWNLSDEDGDNTNHHLYGDLCFLLLCKFELLFNTYETIFGYPRLIELFALKDKVLNVKDDYCGKSIKLSGMKHAVIMITTQLIHLFRGELEARKRK